MSNLNSKQVSAIAELARIEVTEAEAAKLALECGAILGYVSELSAISVTETNPEVGEVYNVLREDTGQHASGEYTEVLLHEMPTTKDGYLVVKKIL